MLIENCDNNKSIWRHDAFEIILIAAELRYVNETYVGACEIINHILRRRDICKHKTTELEIYLQASITCCYLASSISSSF